MKKEVQLLLEASHTCLLNCRNLGYNHFVETGPFFGSSFHRLKRHLGQGIAQISLGASTLRAIAPLRDRCVHSCGKEHLRSKNILLRTLHTILLATGPSRLYYNFMLVRGVSPHMT